MKIGNWCRKLSVTLVAGGLLAPCAARAADLGVNLVTNGNFENVDVNVTGNYGGPRILDWTGPNLFAYSHDGSMTSGTGGAGEPPFVPNYADGAAPPAAGSWYFSSNNTGVADPTDVHDPGVFFQDIDVSTGATATAIAAGNATYAVEAYMSSYADDLDFANVLADFRNSGGTSLGTATVSDNDAGANNVWNLNFVNGIVPVGTASIRVSLYGTSGDPTRGADGYMDNVSLIVRGIPEPTSAILAGWGVAAAGLGARRRRKDS